VGDKNALVRPSNTRARMSEDEKRANRLLDEQLLQSNIETMARAPKNEMGDAIRSIGEMANQKLRKDISDTAPFRKPNSIQQYQHEKEQGDPNALRLSFDEWKKL
jgi:hypothetical protein